MPSKKAGEEGLFVWIWLPDTTEPVVAGRLFGQPDDVVAFLYGQSYLKAPGAIPVYLPELPLRAGPQRPNGMLRMHAAIRDASPDAWGRRVIVSMPFEGLTGSAVRLETLARAIRDRMRRGGTE